MAGDPIFPSSVYLGAPLEIYNPNLYAGAGGNASVHDEGLASSHRLPTTEGWGCVWPSPTAPTGYRPGEQPLPSE
jgi:hypothetical protein